MGPSSICPLAQDNVKRVNARTSLTSDRLIDHNLEDLMDVLVQLSPSLSPPSLPHKDARNVTYGNPIDSSPSQYTNLLPLGRLSKTSLRREIIQLSL